MCVCVCICLFIYFTMCVSLFVLNFFYTILQHARLMCANKYYVLTYLLTYLLLPYMIAVVVVYPVTVVMVLR